MIILIDEQRWARFLWSSGHTQTRARVNVPFLQFNYYIHENNDSCRCDEHLFVYCAIIWLFGWKLLIPSFNTRKSNVRQFNWTYRDIIAASFPDRLAESLERNPLLNGSYFFISSLRLRMLFMEKLVNVALALEESDVFDSVLAGLILDRLIELRIVFVCDVLMVFCGDGSGLDTTSISSSLWWIDMIVIWNYF